jgi:hypothetical protein
MHLTVIDHGTPKLNLPEIVCDRILHRKLTNVPILSLMNKSFCAAVFGKPGSGKTSLIHALLATKALYFQVFHTIILFCPPNSRKSLKNSIFAALPEEQVYDQLTLANLREAWEKCTQNGRQKTPKNTLLIFDDVQQDFTGECRDELLKIQSNRRHSYTSIFFLCQSYKKLPRPNRMGLSDIFGYNLSKDDMEDIYTELVDKPRAPWDYFVRYYRSITESQSHAKEDEAQDKKGKAKDDDRVFIYFNGESNRHFIGWKEIIIDDPKNNFSQLELAPEQATKTKKRQRQAEAPQAPPVPVLRGNRRKKQKTS